MRFKYSAKTKDGSKTQRGEIDAPNKDIAISSLREKGLIVYSLVPANKERDIAGIVTFFQKVKLGDLVVFTDQLANMLTAGLPIARALEIIISQTKNKTLESILESILTDIESGTSLSKSIAKYPEVFDETYISLISAGEALGKLDVVLTKLAESLEKKRQFRSKLKSAMLYPIIIIVVMTLVFIGIVILVIPQISTLYESLNTDLPTSTKLMIGLSDFIRHNWWILAIGIVAIILGFKYFKSTTTGEYFLAKTSLKLPIFGNLLRQSNLVEFTFTLALLLESGVSILDSLKIVKNTFRNVLFRDSVDRMVEEVKHGVPLSQAISKEDLYPPLVSNMLVIGEETGTVDERLSNLSTYFEKEVNKITKNLSTAMEPLIMIMLGIMVLILALAVITPIYKLTSSF